MAGKPVIPVEVEGKRFSLFRKKLQNLNSSFGNTILGLIDGEIDTADDLLLEKDGRGNSYVIVDAAVDDFQNFVDYLRTGSVALELQTADALKRLKMFADTWEIQVLKEDVQKCLARRAGESAVPAADDGGRQIVSQTSNDRSPTKNIVDDDDDEIDIVLPVKPAVPPPTRKPVPERRITFLGSSSPSKSSFFSQQPSKLSSQNEPEMSQQHATSSQRLTGGSNGKVQGGDQPLSLALISQARRAEESNSLLINTSNTSSASVSAPNSSRQSMYGDDDDSAIAADDESDDKITASRDSSNQSSDNDEEDGRETINRKRANSSSSSSSSSSDDSDSSSSSSSSSTVSSIMSDDSIRSGRKRLRASPVLLPNEEQQSPSQIAPNSISSDSDDQNADDSPPVSVADDIANNDHIQPRYYYPMHITLPDFAQQIDEAKVEQLRAQNCRIEGKLIENVEQIYEYAARMSLVLAQRQRIG